MFDDLIDAMMKRARENGDFDNLPGQGKPLDPAKLKADPFAKVYGDGVMTPLGEIQRDIDAARAKLSGVRDPDARRQLQETIAKLETKKAIEMETWKQFL